MVGTRYEEEDDSNNSNNAVLLKTGKRKLTFGQPAQQAFTTRVHGFATKTEALAREIPPATQANIWRPIFIT